MTDAPTTVDPIEIAMEAEASGRAPLGIAHALLTEQRRLTGWQVANERAAFALRMLTGFAGLLALAVVAWFVWSASQARGLVVDAFSVPANLAADGVTGEAAATRLLDRLRDLEARSVTLRAQDSFANSWDGDLKVDIPKAGVSLDQVQRWLRATLGHETHISGEVQRTKDGLALTVRVGVAPGVTFSGPTEALDQVTTDAADAIYRQTQPYRWGVLLYDSDRFAEADEAFRLQARSGAASERAWAFNGWGSSIGYQGRPRDALVKYERGRELDPKNPVIWLNLFSTYERLGRDGEGAHARAEAIRLLGDRGGHGSSLGRIGQRLSLMGLQAQSIGDYAGSRTLFEAALSAPAFRNTNQTAAFDAESVALMHEPSRARRLIAEIPPPASLNAIRRQHAMMAMKAAVLADLEAGDTAAALADASRVRAFAAQQLTILIPWDASLLRPLQAQAQAASGDLVAARATLSGMDADCYRCRRVQGQVAALGGEMALATAHFAAARAIAPTLPFADLDEGRALMARGDFKAAIASFTAANRLGPKFADPLAYWGEALLAQLDAKAAAAKFAAAAAFAPRWGRLHLKWGEALAKLGKADEAKAQWRIAAGLDLTPAERAELTQVSR